MTSPLGPLSAGCESRSPFNPKMTLHDANRAESDVGSESVELAPMSLVRYKSSSVQVLGKKRTKAAN